VSFLGEDLDTAAACRTEAVLGKAIESVRREDVVITTKAPFSFSNPHSTPEGIVASLDKSLRQLDTDYVDVYQLHGVPPNAYDHALNELAPVLLREKAKGKLRHVGITETAPHNPEHQVLHRAGAGWGLGRDHGRVSHDAPECPRACLSADPRQSGRHLTDVRRT
jgi:aryl-alcohol dehydrogenase-like predicted oxidoreductase